MSVLLLRRYTQKYRDSDKNTQYIELKPDFYTVVTSTHKFNMGFGIWTWCTVLYPTNYPVFEVVEGGGQVLVSHVISTITIIIILLQKSSTNQLLMAVIWCLKYITCKIIQTLVWCPHWPVVTEPYCSEALDFPPFAENASPELLFQPNNKIIHCNNNQVNELVWNYLSSPEFIKASFGHQNCNQHSFWQHGYNIRRSKHIEKKLDFN